MNNENENEKINLTDLIDIKLLQELQDTFAKTMGVASIAVDDKGPITKPSNFTDFCIKHTRGTAEGYRRCNECDIKWGKVAAESGKPVIYDCHSGLRDFAVPIVVGGQHIASILGGQILTKVPDEKHFRELARELGIDEDKYIEALEKIKIVPAETVDAAANFLYLVANTISKVAHKNLELIKKNQKENLQRKIIEKIRSSLDIEETLSYICSETAKLFNVQRASVSEFTDPQNCAKHITRMEYKASPEMNGLSKLKHLSEVARYFGCNLLKNNEILAIDNILESNAPDYFKESYNLLGVKSILVIPIQKDKHKWGVLILTEYNNYRHWTEDEIELAKSIASQIYIAINQAELYEKEKETVQREIILRDIIGKIRSSIDIKQIKLEIVNQIGTFLRADGVRIADYNYKLEDYIVSEESEYRSSNKLKSWVGVNFKNIAGFTEYIRNVHLQGKDIIFNDLEAYLDENNLRGTGVENFYREFGFNSSAAINIYYQDMYIGDFVITFEQSREFSDNEINFLKTLADQAGVALHQAQLYEATQINAQREKLLGAIISKAISTLDANQIKQLVKDIGIITKADRCYFVETDLSGMKGKPINYDWEWLASDDVKSIMGYEFPTQDVEKFVELYSNAKDLIVFDYESIRQEQNEEYSGIIKYSNKFDLKSGVGIPFIYMDKLIAVLCIEYVKEKILPSSDELDFLRILGNQVGMAFSQIQLFQNTKQTAEREFLLRKTTEIIRSSLDIKKIKHNFVTELGKILGADRVFIVEYNSETQKYGVLDEYSQYLSSLDEEGLIGYDFSNPEVEYIANILKQRKTFYIPDSELYVKENHLEGTPIGNWLKNQKSGHGNPILYGDKYYGVLIMHYTKAITILSQEKLDFISELAEQLGTAFYQSELYEKSQKQAEKETTLRNIIETIRGTLNFNETKLSIVTEVGKALNADRVFLVIFDPETNTPGVLDEYSEYLSSPDLYSLVGYDFSSPEVGFLSSIHKEAKPIIVQDTEKFIIDNNLQGTPVENWFLRTNMKSGIGTTIFYGKKVYGVLSIHYTKEKVFITNEQIEFLKTLGDQTGIALYQAELFKKEKQTAEREKLLRDINETIRSTLDINEIKNTIVTEICKALNADRCFIIEYEQGNKKFLPVENEYLASPELMSSIGFDLNEEAQELSEKDKMGEDIIITDIDEYVLENNLYNTTTEKHLRESQMQSGFSVPISYANQMLGVLVIHYTARKGAFSDEEFQLVRTLASQIAIALHQAELFEKTKTQAEIQSTILNNIPFMVWLKDIESRFMTVNSKVLDSMNMKLEEIIGQTDSCYAPPELANKYREADLEVINEKKLKVSEEAIIHKGETKWSETFKSPVLNSKGDVIATTGVALDITERKEAEIELKRRQEKIQQQVKRDTLLRGITEKIRSSLDLDETLSFICEETAKLFNVQRTAIAQFPNFENFEDYIIKKEYKSFPEIKGIDQADNFHKAAAYWGNILMQINKVLAYDNLEQSDTPDYFKNTYGSMGIKSMIGTSIRKGNDVWGTLVLSEYNNPRHWTDEEKILLKAIADQVYIAINQAELFETAQTKAQNEKALREIMLSSVSTFDIKEIIKSIVTEAGKLFKADRCFFIGIDLETNSNFPIKDYAEYLSSNDIRSHLTRQPNKDETEGFIKQFKPQCVIPVSDINKEELPNATKKMLIDNLSVKSYLMVPVYYGDKLYGTIVLHYVHDFKQFTQEDLDMSLAIANQSAIVLHQSELYDKVQSTAQNEKTLRQIMLSSVSTFDIKEIIKSIVTEAGKLFQADRCFYIEINLETMTNSPIQGYAEYLSSNDIRSHLTRQPSKDDTIMFIELAKQRKVIFEDNVETADLPESTRKMLIDDLSVKSNLVVPVYFGDFLYGTIVIQYVHDFKRFTQEDIDMSLAIANQSAIVIHQAELYEITKIQAEREKISKNIIEILRSTLDKSIIKKLFVKNIGKFLDADRVIFSEFDPKTNTYCPVDKDSEYLFDSNIKSFVGYDWSRPEVQEYIQPLLERREFHIYNWNEYIQSNSRSQDFINLFEDLNIKSSYSFPVMYQTKIMGFFSIHFIRNVRRLTEEDINRIRNICTQAGIALYHSNLYEEAQKSVQTHAEFVNKLSNELKNPLDMIIEFSHTTTQHELECHDEIEHLNNINNNAKKLLYLLDNIVKNSNTKIDFD